MARHHVPGPSSIIFSRLAVQTSGVRSRAPRIGAMLGKARKKLSPGIRTRFSGSQTEIASIVSPGVYKSCSRTPAIVSDGSPLNVRVGGR